MGDQVSDPPCEYSCPDRLIRFLTRAIRLCAGNPTASVLPLLKEEQEGSGTAVSTVDERIINAGLETLKDKDAPAIKRLFGMFAVTQVRHQ